MVLFTITKTLDRFSTFNTRLYDASSVDSTDSLLADVSTIIDHGRNNVKGFGDLSSFIPTALGFRPAGKTEGVDSTTVQFQISGQSDTVEVEIMEVTIIPGAQSKQGVTLRNNLGITVFVTSPISVEPPVEPAPEPGPPVSISWVCDATTMHNSYRPCSVWPLMQHPAFSPSK